MLCVFLIVHSTEISIAFFCLPQRAQFFPSENALVSSPPLPLSGSLLLTVYLKQLPTSLAVMLVLHVVVYFFLFLC